MANTLSSEVHEGGCQPTYQLFPFGVDLDLGLDLSLDLDLGLDMIFAWTEQRAG